MGILPGNGDEHRYQHCKDEDCDRFSCRLYKEGYRNGREDGYQDGYEQGFPERGHGLPAGA